MTRRGGTLIPIHILIVSNLELAEMIHQTKLLEELIHGGGEKSEK